MKRTTIRIPDPLWERLQQEAVRLGFIDNADEESRGMNKFVNYIFRQYFEKPKTSDPRGDELTKLIEDQKTFMQNLESILKSASNIKQPEIFSEAQNRILALIESVPKSFAEIQSITKINENELLVILGHLFNLKKIGYDTKWRYYKL